MSKFHLSPHGLKRLSAQVQLAGTFNHTLRASPNRQLPLRIAVDRNEIDTTFRVEIGTQRHSVTLDHDQLIHLRLADFIEEIANGPELDQSPDILTKLRSVEGVAGFTDEIRSQVFGLVSRGGALELDVGLPLPIILAIHRNKTRSAITAIMSIGVKRPRTQCFTASGSELDMYEVIAESLHYLITVASPATKAA